jgi:hypothetical protein
MRLFLSLLLAACAHRPVRDEMSAEAHRREAALLRADAADQCARYDPTAMGGGPGSFGREGPSLFPVVVQAPFNPTLGHLYRADELAFHAREHERAAAALEADEESRCRAFPPALRAACPMAAPLRVEDLANGVRLYLPVLLPLDPTVEHMRCHLAWAHTRGFAPTADCPSYLPRMEIRARPEEHAVDLVSDDPATAKRLQQLSR